MLVVTVFIFQSFTVCLYGTIWIYFYISNYEVDNTNPIYLDEWDKGPELKAPKTEQIL